MTTTVVQTLETAKNLLIEKGRIVADLINDAGCMCALGAIGVAAVGEEKLRERRYYLFEEIYPKYQSPEAIAAGRAVVEELRGTDFHSDADEDLIRVIWSYNDAEGRTDQEVLDLLDRAISTQKINLTPPVE